MWVVRQFILMPTQSNWGPWGSLSRLHSSSLGLSRARLDHTCTLDFTEPRDPPRPSRWTSCMRKWNWNHDWNSCAT